MRRQARDPAERTLTLVMAGVDGSRLGDLTRLDARPALTFGGHYRNVDFALSNSVNSGVRRIALLTQRESHSLIQHVKQGLSFLRPELGEFLDVWPAQQRRNKNSYTGTADSIYQNIDLIERLAPERVLILAGDHVYRMDYRPMLETHAAAGFGATVGCVEVPLSAARELGVIATDASGRVRQFAEKPKHPWPVRSRPDVSLASMGIYVFDRDLLIDCLCVDAEDPTSTHDFGRDVLPLLIRAQAVTAHPFRDERDGRPGYWRDVATVDGYWSANLDLLSPAPPLDLYDRRWPIYTHNVQRPPARVVGAGLAVRSIVAGGCTIGGRVEDSVLAADCIVRQDTVVRSCVVSPGVEIGFGCRLRNAVIESGCVVPDGFVIGEDPEADAARFAVTPQGAVLVTAQMLEGLERTGRELASCHT